jgi:hypothetical protein
MGAERQFIEEVVNRAVARGVGIGRTSAHVAEDIRTAMQELLWELKSEVR